MFADCCLRSSSLAVIHPARVFGKDRKISVIQLFEAAWAFVFSALLGALLSPPEITTQVVIGLGFYLWYEILIMGMWIYWIKVGGEEDRPFKRIKS